MFRNIKKFVVVLLVLILAASTFAFANVNTITDSALGYLAQGVQGYTVSAVVYDLDNTDPTKLHTVAFKLTSIDVAPAAMAPGFVAINVLAVPNWTNFTCSITGAASPWVATCVATADPSVTLATTLDIVASSSADTVTPP